MAAWNSHWYNTVKWQWKLFPHRPGTTGMWGGLSPGTATLLEWLMVLELRWDEEELRRCFGFLISSSAMSCPAHKERYLVLAKAELMVGGLGKPQMSSKIKRKESDEALEWQQKPDRSVYKYLWHSFSEATLLFVLIAVLECCLYPFLLFIPTAKYTVRAFLITELEVSEKTVSLLGHSPTLGRWRPFWLNSWKMVFQLQFMLNILSSKRR